MDIKDLDQFREILIKDNEPVSEIEYTKNNYDNAGNLINDKIPTITANFCEIGLYNDEIYLVFILKSTTFNLDLFNQIKNKPNIKIYGFTNFNKTLFPIENFNLDNFLKEIIKDKYLQIQFDFKNISPFDLFTEYKTILNIFDKYKITLIKQLEKTIKKL